MIYYRFFCITMKRTITNFTFIAVLFVLFISSYVIYNLSDVENINLSFGYVSDIDMESSEYISFKKFDNEKELKNAVESNVVEAGFIIDNSVTDNIFTDNEKRIKVYKNSRSLTTSLACELIYSRLMDKFSYRLFDKSFHDSGADKVDGFDTERVKKLANIYKNDDATYKFTYRKSENGRNIINNSIFPFKYVASVLFIIIIIIGINFFVTDIKNGLFLRTDIIKKTIFLLTDIITPAIFYIVVCCGIYLIN